MPRCAQVVHMPKQDFTRRLQGWLDLEDAVLGTSPSKRHQCVPDLLPDLLPDLDTS